MGDGGDMGMGVATMGAGDGRFVEFDDVGYHAILLSFTYT